MPYYPPLLADNIYHIVSRAVGSEKLFLHDENYRYFLERFDKYISPVADSFAWSLLPNHFHFLLQVKPMETLLNYYKILKPNGKTDAGWQPDFVMQQFSNLLNSYAKSFNKRYKRKGALFMDYLRRVAITSAAQCNYTVFYIHKNAAHHGYCNAIEDWPWSSYAALLSNAPTKLQRQKVLDWFGGYDKFIEYHRQPFEKN